MDTYANGGLGHPWQTPLSLFNKKEQHVFVIGGDAIGERWWWYDGDDASYGMAMPGKWWCGRKREGKGVTE